MFRHPTVLYHGTLRSKLPSIYEHGLDPKFTKSSLDAVFLAASFGDAENYCGMYDQESNQDEHIVLEIDFTALDQTLLGPDNYELAEYLDGLEEDDELYGTRWSDCTWEQSLRWCGQVAYHGVVPATAILTK